MPLNSIAVRADAASIRARSQALLNHSRDLCLRAQRARTRVSVFHRPLRAAPEPDPPEPLALPEHQQMQMEALQAMSAVLAQFPLEDQVAMVKALTARTLIKVAEQQGMLAHTAPLTLSA